MIYRNILIDSSNLFYRLQRKNDSCKSAVKRMIGFVEETSMAHLSPDGTVYLLFDPVAQDDLGESKSFEVTSYRKMLSRDYKCNRTHSPIFKSTISLFMKYFAYKGEKIKLVYSQMFEADDYVEPLLEKLTEGDRALVSNDEDWARYIDDKTFLISKGYDEPFDKKDFYNKFKFYPTPAANTLYKAIYGDKSDNITGCIFMKKAKFITNIKKTAYDYIKWVSENDVSLDEIEKAFSDTTMKEVNNKVEEKTPFDILFSEFSIASQKENVLGKFQLNIKLIKSQLQGKDVSQFVHWNEERQKYNEVIRQSIYGLNMKSWFGKV